MATEPRHDYYQTDTSVIVSVYVKGCKADDVECDIDDKTLNLKVSAPSPVASLQIAPLWSQIDPSSSSHKVLGSKIEIKLQKIQVGQHWTHLKGSLGDANQPTPPIAVAPVSSTKSAAPRARSKWDSFEAVDEDGKVIEEGNDGVDAFFKQLYAGADDDTRRAMMKSYQESGGTSLSTNWSEVGKKKVETSPPEGMEARKW